MVGHWLALALLAALGAQQDTDVSSEPIVEQEQYGPYFVFFGFDSSQIDRDGEDILRGVADDYASSKGADIRLTGHTDRSGASAYNKRLSQRRVEAVRSRLVALGVAAQDVSIGPDGEGQPLIETADGVREAQNRRVEIYLTPTKAAAQTERH